MKNNDNVVEKLDNLNERQYYADYNRGWNDYFADSIITEELENNLSYRNGCNEAAAAKAWERSCKRLRAHKEEILAALRESRARADKAT